MLSICIPTYNRPELLERALLSITTAQINTDALEIVISDNSTNSDSREVSERVLSSWTGRWRYLHNDPGLYVIDNFNHAIFNSSADFVLSLGDDDYFLPGGVEAALETLKQQSQHDCFLLGVHMVTLKGQVLKRQSVSRDCFLEPRDAYLRVLSDSSYVRESGVMLRKSTFDTAGHYDSEAGNLADLDMWLRLFKTTGLYRASGAAVAVTAHAGAITNAASFHQEALGDLLTRFERERASGFVNEDVFEKATSTFLYQYVLAGVWRSLRARDMEQARATFDLLGKLPDYTKAVPDKWFFPWLGASVLFRFYDMGRRLGLSFG